MLHKFSQLIIFIGLSTSAFAWGSLGHETIANIASELLIPAVKDSVQKYLGSMTMEQAAVWMDKVRGNKAYDYLKPLHYVNIEKDKTYEPTGKPNIVNELQKVITELQYRNTLSKQQIATDLKILFHLVGDIGQPLHVGYPEDEGGNRTEVIFHGKKTSLHHLWDTDIIENNKTSIQEIYTAKLWQYITPTDKKIYGQIDVLDWLKDSRSFLPKVYTFKNDSIDWNYEKENLSIINNQIMKSGLRLAAVLNSVFSE
jgi:hypothetical protein